MTHDSQLAPARQPVNTPRMRQAASMAVVWALAGASVGCGDDGGEPAPTTSGWEMLVEGDWSLPSGDEGYTCVRRTLDEDLFVRGFRPIAPNGTHHTVLSIDQGGGADGVFPCDAATNGQNMLFGSGVGTGTLELPEGVAIKIPKGSSVLLNLHLFNVYSETLTGLSGVEVQRVGADDVIHEAEIVLAGKTSGLSVPPGATTQTGACAMSHDVTLFAVFPHMHQLGVHLKATAEPAGAAPTVLVDMPYSFESQVYYPVDPMLSLKAGDKVSVECHYENPGAETVTFGDSSLEEMCFAGLYRYPKGAGGLVCTEGGGPVIDGPPCAEDGAPGNESSVGKHCTEGGGECAGGGAPLCIADYVDGDFGNFCSKLCQDDSDCGSGAVCLGSASTKSCIPAECAASLGG